MILGLCSSFAVVPAVSLVTGGSGASRRSVGPNLNTGISADVSTEVMDPVSLAAILTSGASLSAMFRQIASTAHPAAGAAAAKASPASKPASSVRSSVASAASATSAASRATAKVTGPASKPVLAIAAVPAAVAAVPAAAQPKAAAPSPAVAPATRAVPHASTGHSQQGVASWLDISAGTCANNAAPMGAIITVTSVAGITITCKVVSRGPFGVGRVVDLARATFAALQLPSRGLVDVSVSW